jgi:hypothetical protein
MKMRLLTALILVSALAACAKQFPVSNLNAEEQNFEQALRADQGNEAKVALAQMYFKHNRIDEVDGILSSVVAAEPNNAQAAAWYGANNCKKAARRGPWLLGMDKLYLVKECLRQVDNALAAASDDFVVQMVQMNTGAEVDAFDSLKRAKSTKDRVEKNITANPKSLPGDALAQFYVTAAKIERKSRNTSAATNYLDRALKLATAPATLFDIDAERQQLGGK